GGETAVGARPDDRGATHWSNPERRRVMLAEQVDADRWQHSCDAIARHQLDGVQRIPIARDAAVSARAAVEVFEREARPVTMRVPAQIRDRRKAAVQLRKTWIVS